MMEREGSDGERAVMERGEVMKREGEREVI